MLERRRAADYVSNCGDVPLARRISENGSYRTPQPIIGVVDGEGVGPEVTRAALDALAAVSSATGLTLEIRRSIPTEPGEMRLGGSPLYRQAEAFCRETFEDGGAVLCGPGGGRFVYDLRRRFDLYCKVSRIRSHPELLEAGPFRPEHVRDVDLVFVRDNAGGVYQGEWSERQTPDAGRVAEHRFGYSERQVRRVAEVAASIASTRRRHITVVVKQGGVPSVSRLWCDVANEVAARHGIACESINADHAAYRVLREPGAFDLLLTPNLFGDLLMDGAAVLQGSRALSFSGNFSGDGSATYQSNHGSACDIEGKDVANPVAQIFALAMLLRESLGAAREARLLEEAVSVVWRAGVRTADLALPGGRSVGTREFSRLVAEAASNLARAAAAS